MWEVECTAKVKKFFTDNELPNEIPNKTHNKIPKHEKKMVVKTLQKLVSGIPTGIRNLYKEAFLKHAMVKVPE